jgi:hypothetical protein
MRGPNMKGFSALATVATSAESARYDKENDGGCRIKDPLIIKFPKGNEPWRIQHTSLAFRCP